MAVQRQLRVLDSSAMEGVSTACMKVAFATADLKSVNQHFGAAERFAIYAVKPDEATLLEVAEFGDLAQDGNENKLVEKFVVLDGCAAVYCQAVGGSAVRQLLGLGVQPLKVAHGTPINQLVEELQAQLKQGPGGWVARAIKQIEKQTPDRFDAMEEEGWVE
jgi:nitrogen fixation protein NifX